MYHHGMSFTLFSGTLGLSLNHCMGEGWTVSVLLPYILSQICVLLVGTYSLLVLTF